MGFQQIAGVHRQNAIFTFGQSKIDGSAEGLGAECDGHFAFSGSGVCGGDFREHDADAGPAESFARGGGGCGRDGGDSGDLRKEDPALT